MQSSKETLTERARSEHIVQTSLEGISKKAKREKKYRFRDLYRQINYGALKLAWKKLNKKAAAGVDKITAREFEKNLEENLKNILESLKGKRYHAKLVRRKYIDKGNGKKRPLGIPALSDKIVQRAAADILEAIYEQDFIEKSYGYRPNKSAKQAVIDLTDKLQSGKYNYIVEADIKGFFDNIDHDWLVKMLEERINDRQFIRLIKKWLRAGILEEDGKVIHPITGTPQGGIISSVLVNIYLHYVLDIWFKGVIKKTTGDASIYRYADDFVCAFRYRKDAEMFYQVLLKRLKKFKLELSMGKTNIILFSRHKKNQSGSFEFLGFEFRRSKSYKGKDIIKRRTSRKKLRKSIKNFTLQRHIKANKLFWGFLTGKYGKIEKKYRFLGSVILTTFKVELLCRKFDSEINLIVIDKEYRGLGIGTKLITRFLDKTKQKGSKSIYLYTDIESNWKFYEIYGFKRYRKFHDYELSFLKDKNICSFIYVYNI